MHDAPPPAAPEAKRERPWEGDQRLR
jgi:hypothetical protein